MTGAAGPEIGENVIVRLEKVGTSSGVWFDQVSLSVTLIPEPSTLVLAVLGLLGLGFATRCKQSSR